MLTPPPNPLLQNLLQLLQSQQQPGVVSGMLAKPQGSEPPVPRRSPLGNIPWRPNQQAVQQVAQQPTLPWDQKRRNPFGDDSAVSP